MVLRSGLALAAVAALSAAFAPAAPAQRDVTVISGTVLGVSGAPLKFGHVHVYPERYPRRVASAPIGADGRFAIATTATGPLHLLATGVDHYPVGIPLMVERPATIGLDVRLRHYLYTDSLERITAIGDWNHFNFGTGRPLVRQPDGRYTLDIEVTGDTLAYQFLGLEVRGTRSINGTQADRYAYDNGGDYRSVIRAQRGLATIVFDPSALVRQTGEMSVTFRDPRSRVARMYARYRDWSAQRIAFLDSTMAARARRDSLRYDWMPIIAERAAALNRERDPLTRQLLLLQLWEAEMFSGVRDVDVARRVVREVPPSSPWWAFRDLGGVQAVWLAEHVSSGRALDASWRSDTATARAVLTFLDRVVAEHPDSMVQSEALSSAIFFARTVREDARSNDYYLRIVTDYSDSPDIAYLRSRYAPNRLQRAGQQMPAFSFAGLDDSTVTFTRESMLGRRYLLQFWATWCGPCIREMPYLHAAHDSLAADSVEFLAVSMDNRREDVQRLRRGEWPMPWLHAFAPGGFENPQTRRLEILAVPTALLIGPDGTILAVDPRGEHLVAQVRQALLEARSR